MVRVLFTILILTVCIWSGYWWVGSSAQQSALTAWFDDRRAAGWVADYKALDVRGYPSRFDTRIVDLNLADVKSGLAWSAPEFQVLMLSYKPNHIIAVWPQKQTISTVDERIDISSKDIRASVKFDADTALALNSTTAELEDVSFESTAGWTSHMATAKLASRQTTGVKNAHDVFFQAKDVKPARIFKKLMDPDNLLPEVFNSVRTDLTAGFDAPWDRHAVEGRKPEPTSLIVREFTATWGKLELQATGDLVFDAQGYPTGKISVRAKNWRDMLALAVGAGVIPPELQNTLESGLGLLARLSGNPDTIDAPLSFKNQVMSLGPIPIGRAPKLQLNP